MKSILRYAALPLALAVLPLAVPAQAAVKIYVNGEAMHFDQPPVTQAGRVFVPLRGVFQALGASVVFSNGQIDATGDGRTISLTIGSTRATVDGRPSSLDAAPFLIGSRTMIPLRFVAQSLGASVNWDEADNSVVITSGAPAQRPAPSVYFVYRSPSGPVAAGVRRVGFELNRSTEPSLFQTFLDGSNVTPAVVQNGARYSFETPALTAGRHRVRVVGRTTGGVPFDLRWSFTVTP